MVLFVILIETIVLPANIPVLDGGLTENRRYWIPQNDLFWETWVRQTHMCFFCRGCNVFISSIDVHPPPAHLRNTKKNMCFRHGKTVNVDATRVGLLCIRSSPSWSSFYGHGSRSVRKTLDSCAQENTQQHTGRKKTPLPFHIAESCVGGKETHVL